MARHPNRPTFLDIALNITDKFVELHGDRAGIIFRAVDLHMVEAQAQQHITDSTHRCMHQQCTLPVVGLDDPAMVAGIGSIDGVSYMMIGQQKGRNTKVLFVTDMPVWRWLHSVVAVEPACIMPGCWHMLDHSR